MELQCAVQKYAWGKLGSTSAVAKLVKGCSDVAVDENASYAELWMGTHPNGPSVVKDTKQPLAELIQENPAVLGEKSRGVFGDELPFLFKVLSVRQALSIQAHPDKERAKKLHAAFPDLYKDPNHKPEIAVALTPFTALCGFRPVEEIRKFTDRIEEFREAVGEENVKLLHESSEEQSLKGLREGFATMMRQPKDKVESLTRGLMERVKDAAFVDSLDLGEGAKLLQEVLVNIYKDFPGDIGLFGVLMFNLMVLQPGESIFLGADVPHAYLLGDCVECMACSDNVVRAGLTPKFIDVDTLVEMLIYEFSSSNDRLFQGQSIGGSSGLKATEYNPPVDDFTVARYELQPGSKESLPAVDSASIIVVIECEKGLLEVDGKAVDLMAGKVFFLPAGMDSKASAEGGRLLMFRAYVKL